MGAHLAMSRDLVVRTGGGVGWCYRHLLSRGKDADKHPSV